MSILIVDDDDTANELAANFLRIRGYTVVQAVTGAQALENALKHRLRVIVIPGKLMNVDGMDLCRRIRSIQGTHYVYCILVSADSNKDEKLSRLRQGADAILTGPMDLEELEAFIQAGMRMTTFSPDKPSDTGSTADDRTGHNSIAEINHKDDLTKEDVGEYDILFAKIALEQQLITKEMLAKAFSFQKRGRKSGNSISLGDVFLKRGMVTKSTVDGLHAAVKKHLDKSAESPLKLDYLNAIAIIPSAQTGRPCNEPLSYRVGSIIVTEGEIPDEPLDKNGRQESDKRPSELPGSGRKEPEPTTQEPQKPARAEQEANFQLVVSGDRLEAHIRFDLGTSGCISPEEISKCLRRESIVFGVVGPEAVAECFNMDIGSVQSIRIAKGLSPVPGLDASIDYYFDTDYLKAGTVDKDGKIDYRERGKAPRVKSGDLLTRKKVMAVGKPGVDIYGKTIPVPDPKDIHLKCGQGALLSEDGLEIYAAIDGQPNLAVGGEVSVFSELVIDGDVNFNTGNINFDGNVCVKGSIMSGFTVKCGNLNAAGIFSAQVLAMGDVTVSGGIIGSDVKSEGSVTAKFITDSNIKAFGNVVVEKEVIQTKIRSSGAFQSNRGKIITSFVSAKMGFEARDVGTDLSSPCRIHVGMDENVKKRIQALDYAINEKKQNLEKLQKNYEQKSREIEAIHRRITDLVQFQERLVSTQRLLMEYIEDSRRKGVLNGLDKTEARVTELKARQDAVKLDTDRHFKTQETLDATILEDYQAVESIIKEIESIGEEKAAIQKWSKEEKGVPVVRVSGVMTPGTLVYGIQSSIVLKDVIRNSLIREMKQEGSNEWRMIVEV
ncbi:MAG: FapA family protein [Pseudomonadota bacterium]